MRSAHMISLGAAAYLATTPVAAQTIPLRKLTQIVASDSGAIGGALGVRQLPNGSVLVNDASRFRIVVLDSTLKNITVFAGNDGAPNRYGTQQGILVPYVGDSTIFFDQQATAFVVIDPTPRVVRTTAPPKPEDAMAIMIGYNTGQGFDPAGRLIYRVTRRSPPAPPAPRADSGTVTITIRHDSTAIVRADPNTRSIDTIGLVANPISKLINISTGNGSRGTSAVNPLPQRDEWTLLPDGTLAIVRGIDYHIDWIAPNGTKTSTPKMPFDWRRVTDEEKVKMIDSARKAYEARAAAPPPPRPSNSMLPPMPVLPPIGFYAVDPSEMPDYYPPIRVGTVKADRDGNVWILPSTSRLAAGGLVYDVVNRKGEVFERVELPPGRNIAGFGPGGVVYMSSVSAPGVARFERARIAR